MKHLLAAVALLVPLTTLADNFAGPYAGIYTGYAWGEDEGTGYSQLTGNKNGWAQKTYPTGVQYGLLGGYNWTLEDQLVLGLEADVEGRADDSDRDHQKFYGSTDSHYAETTKLSSAASLRGRLGYLFTPQALVFVTAGYAAADVKRTWHDGYAGDKESHSSWQDGWTAGVGAEYLLSERIATRLEYRYADYGTDKVAVNMWGEYYKQRLTDQSIRAGLSYQF